MKFGAFVVVLAVLIGVGAWITGWELTAQTRTCTVLRTDRTTVSTGDGSRSDARVYTSDCGVLDVADDALRLHFDSADTYGQLGAGRYRFETVGWRFPLFSVFPNVVDAKRVAS